MGPIEFKEERETREKAIIARLMDIRKAQIEYKNIHRQHAGTFAELITFLKEEKLPFLKKEGVLTDAQLESGMTEAEAVKEGIIKRDTFFMLAQDTIFGKGYNADSIRFVPGFSKEFKMDTASITNVASGYTIKVFEANVDYDTYLGDLDAQQVANLKDVAEKLTRFEGLRVGSLTEVNNYAGNWENE
jgi:hypothetical protein